VDLGILFRRSFLRSGTLPNSFWESYSRGGGNPYAEGTSKRYCSCPLTKPGTDDHSVPKLLFTTNRTECPRSPEIRNSISRVKLTSQHQQVRLFLTRKRYVPLISMPNVHVIIGEANTRKGSLLRCLTGVGSAKGNLYMDVMQTSGSTITVYCVSRSLQENYRPMTPSDFIAFIGTLRPAPTDIAVTLRVRARGGYPTAIAYLNAFARARWTIVNVALLGTAACALPVSTFSRSIAPIPHSASQPNNQSARSVRRVWRWR